MSQFFESNPYGAVLAYLRDELGHEVAKPFSQSGEPPWAAPKKIGAVPEAGVLCMQYGRIARMPLQRKE